jgi:hypothetical protein
MFHLLPGLIFDSHAVALTLFSLLAGLLCGISNSLSENRVDRKNLFTSILISTIATLCVPLFLHTISSELVRVPSPKGALPNPFSYLVYFGLCLLAGLRAPNFIQSLSTRAIFDKIEEKEKKDDSRFSGLEGTVNTVTDLLVGNSRTEPSDGSDVESEESLQDNDKGEQKPEDEGKY